MAKADTAVAVRTELTSDELTALLQEQGFMGQPSAGMPRISMKGTILQTPDGGQYVYNPRKPTEPAMTVRIMRPLDEYFAIWIDAEEADHLGRPELKGTFSKKFMKNDPERKLWDSDAEYDRLKSAGFKSSWKGDLIVTIAPDDGTFTGNEVPHVLTLSTTSVIEFKGAGGKPEGSVSDKNFIQKLVAFAVEEAKPDSKETAERAVLNALTSYSLGGVVAEIRPTIAEDKALNRTWTVLVFDPIHIEPLSEAPAIASGDDEDPGL